MGVQVEPMNPPLEQYGPWHFGDVGFHGRHAGLEAAALQRATIPGLSDRLLEISKTARADCHSPARPEVALSVSRVPRATIQGPSRPTPGIPSPSFTGVRRSLFPATIDPSLTFAPHTPSGTAVVTFPLSTPQPRPCLKRRRPDTDVSGPGTSPLSCKKRRLLRYLITSRLSQPFSLPATHILNRESVTAGDKRIVKLSAIMSARRLNSAVAAPAQAPQQQQPSPSTWMRRAAVLNSLRSRVYAAATERVNVSVPVPDLAAKAAALQQSHGSTAFGGRYLVDSANSPRNGAPPIVSGPPQTPPNPHHHPGTRVHTQTTPPSPATNPIHIHVHVPTTAARSLRIPSPKLRPLRSPELRVTRPLVPLDDDIHIPDLLDSDHLHLHRHHHHNGNTADHHHHNNKQATHHSNHNNISFHYDHDGEDEDTDTMAFPTSELESRYADDDDDDSPGEGGVYADFSLIFGGEEEGDDDDDGGGYAGSGWGGGGTGGDHFEDYMDDLDGIPGGLAPLL